MKAALAAWGSNSNLFHQGFASEATDPRIIAAAMKMPGVVLKRPGRNKRTVHERLSGLYRGEEGLDG